MIFRNFLAGLSAINAVAKSIYAVAVVQQNGFITQFDNFHHRSGVFFLLFIFKLFFKHNDLVLGYWVQDLSEFCSYEPNSTKALKCQVSYITASPFMTLKVSRHSERSEESSQFSHTHYKISLDSAPSNLTQLRQQVAKFRISALPQDDGIALALSRHPRVMPDMFRHQLTRHLSQIQYWPRNKRDYKK